MAFLLASYEAFLFLLHLRLRASVRAALITVVIPVVSWGAVN